MGGRGHRGGELVAALRFGRNEQEPRFCVTGEVEELSQGKVPCRVPLGTDHTSWLLPHPRKQAKPRQDPGLDWQIGHGHGPRLLASVLRIPGNRRNSQGGRRGGHGSLVWEGGKQVTSRPRKLKKT